MLRLLIAIIFCSFFTSQAATKEKRLNIAFVVDSYANAKSGAIISIRRFIKNLAPKHNITIITSGKGVKDQDLDVVYVKSFYFPLFKNKMKKNGIKFGYAKKAKLQSVLKNMDLVYVHFPFMLGLKTVKLAKKMGKPVITGFHLQPENMFINIGIRAPFINKGAYKFFIKKFYNRADLVICPSKFAEKILTKNSNFTSKTKVISNGITTKFRPTNTPRNDTTKNPLVLLSVGRFAKEKRQIMIVKALLQSKYQHDIKLVLAGSGSPSQEIKEAAKKLKIKPEIGYVSSKKLSNLYQTANVFVHASEVELEGMSVLDATGVGLPILVAKTKSSAAKQFVLSKKHLFKSTKDLTKKIDFMYKQKQNLEAIGAKYAEKAKEYYIENSILTLEQTIKQYALRS